MDGSRTPGHPDCHACLAIQEAIANLKKAGEKEVVGMGTFRWIIGLLFVALLGILTFQPVLLSNLAKIQTTQAVMDERLDGLKEHVDEIRKESKLSEGGDQKATFSRGG